MAVGLYHVQTIQKFKVLPYLLVRSRASPSHRLLLYFLLDYFLSLNTLLGSFNISTCSFTSKVELSNPTASKQSCYWKELPRINFLPVVDLTMVCPL